MGCLSCVQSLSYDLNFVTACAVYNIVYFGPKGECFPTLSAMEFCLLHYCCCADVNWFLKYFILKSIKKLIATVSEIASKYHPTKHQQEFVLHYQGDPLMSWISVEDIAYTFLNLWSCGKWHPIKIAICRCYIIDIMCGEAWMVLT